MAKIKIVTDSTSDIPREVREAHGIEVVPLKVHFGSDTYYDGVDLDAAAFYRKLAAAEELPTTSQPSPVDFMELYKKLADGPDTAIISLHLSAAFSGTIQSAMLAKSLLEDQMRIEIVDSKSASYGLGMLAVAAAEAARAGKSVEETLDIVQRLRRETKLYFIVDTLEYLQKGGRIGKAAALLGSLLNLKPILTIDDGGVVAPVDKVRGSKKATARMIELLLKDFEGKTVDVCMMHSAARERAEELYGLVSARLSVRRHMYAELGPVIGTHVGPGTLAVIASPVQ